MKSNEMHLKIKEKKEEEVEDYEEFEEFEDDEEEEEEEEDEDEEEEEEEVGKELKGEERLEEYQSNSRKSVSLWNLYFALSSKTDIFIVIIAFIFSFSCGFIYNLLDYIEGKALNHLIFKEGDDSSNYLSIIKKDIIYMAISSFIVFIFSMIHFFLWSYNGKKLALKYKKEYFRLLLAQEQTWFDKRNVYEIASRVESQTKGIEQGLGIVIGNSVFSVSFILSGIVFAMLTSWKLTLACFSMSPLILYFGYNTEHELDEAFFINKENYQKAQGIAEEVLYNFKTVSSFYNYKYELERFDQKLTKAYNSGMIRIKNISYLIAGFFFFLEFGHGIGIVYSSYLIRDQENISVFGGVLKPGDIYIVMTIIFHTIEGLSEEIPNFKAIIEACSSAYNFFKLRNETINKNEKLSLTEKKKIPNDKELQEMANTSDKVTMKKPNNINKANILFKNVHFSYPSNPRKKILKNLNFRIKQNTLNAFVGASGSGKTTIISLLERFYEIDHGEIKIDGCDIRDLDKAYLRSLIGFVPQEPILFNKTIRENILIGREDISEEQLLKACEMAYLTNFIANLENGLDTIVGVKGSKISGGEKQRIAIARAIVGNPKILIFDEATSALDNKSEKKVQMAIDSISRKMTTIVIAHRLSTIFKADKILVLKNGKIIESGNHISLMKKRGYYSHLIKPQIEKFKEEEKKCYDNSSEIIDESLNNSLSRDKIEKRNVLNDSENNQTLDDLTNEESFILNSEIESKTDDVSKMKVENTKKRLFEIVAEDPRIFYMTIASSLLLGLIYSVEGLIEPFYYQSLINEKGENLITVGWFYTVMHLLMAFVLGGVFYMQNYSYEAIGEHLTKRLRQIVFEKYLRMHVAFHDKNENNPGALLTRLSYDAANLNNIVLSAIGVLIQAVVVLLICTSICFYFNWKLNLVNIGSIPLYFFSSYFYFKVAEAEVEVHQEFESQAGQLLSECVCNSKTVFAYNFQAKATKIYKEIINEPFRNLKWDTFVKAFLYGLSQGIVCLPIIINIYLGANMIVSGESTFGDVIKAIFTFAEGIEYLGTTQQYIGDLRKATDSLKNMAKIQERKSLQDPFEVKEDSISPNKIRGKIEFRNVSFSYPSRKKLVLKNVSFVINPGQIVAFVGPSGSGKTTIVQLLERFYDIPYDDSLSSGQILLDDIDIRDYNPESLRKFISLVGQEPVLFKRSVRENIRYGKLDAQESEIEKVAQMAQIKHLLDERVSDLPVSGGEKQRIAIARAIIRDPKILILDEATSALDKNTEEKIQKTLYKIVVKRTCIVIAHRLSTIKNADKIFFLENGSIIEQGDHQSLIDLQGKYFDLLNTGNK